VNVSWLKRALIFVIMLVIGIAYVWQDIVGIIVMGILLFSFSRWWFWRAISK
jgi:putative flippase GtrA